ncbi:MAG: type I restriction endonuclease MjaXP subunit S [Candidatus Woesearchaeota archaeon]|nr:MAG: type I restriction endonuclease MjaXP subunit S [Candidatus Woesearchaeota archaeon]
MKPTKPKLKQTEIGEIPEDWEVKPICEICKITLGGTPKTEIKKFWNGKIKWATAKDVVASKSRYVVNTERTITEEGVKNSNAKIHSKNTIVITSRGTVGAIALLPEEMTFNQTCYGLKTKEDYDTFYIFYFLKNSLKHLKSVSYGTVFETITTKTFEELKIPLPPLPEQRAIARILSAFDDKIELLENQNKTLEAIGQAIFKRWFVDFEFPNEEGKPYKSSGGEMVYNEELGKEIPKEWEVKKLKDIVARLGPGTNFQPKRTEKGIPFLNVKNISSGFLDLKDIKYISKEDFSLVHKSWKPEEYDVLISRIGTLGNVAVIRKEDLPLSVHYNIIDIKPKDTSHGFLYFLLKSNYFQKEFHLKKVQTVQEYITIDNVENIKIVLPHNNLLIVFDRVFLNIFTKLEKNFSQSLALSSLRDLLLPKLMSGKIRVPLNFIEETNVNFS